MAFSKEELEEMARADAEIDAEPDELSLQEYAQSEKLDRAARIDALAPEKRLEKEKQQNYMRRYREKENVRERNRLWFREYYKTHKEKEAERKRLWYLQNRERILMHQSEYRRKERRAGNDASPD